jgi:F-type H+-transporting ATPase subunit b
MLSIDYSVLVIFAIVWILVLVLTKVYFKPLRRVMRERDDKIQQDLDDTQKALERYDNALGKIEGDLKAAKSAAREIREKFAGEAQKEKEVMIEEVSQECRTQVANARKELDEKAEHLKEELEPKGQDLANRIAKRILN